MDSRAHTSPATWCSCIRLPGQQINHFTPSSGFCCTPSPPPVPLAQLPTPAVKSLPAPITLYPFCLFLLFSLLPQHCLYSLFLAELCPLPLLVCGVCPPLPLSLHFGCSPLPLWFSPPHRASNPTVTFPRECAAWPCCPHLC